MKPPIKFKNDNTYILIGLPIGVLLMWIIVNTIFVLKHIL